MALYDSAFSRSFTSFIENSTYEEITQRLKALTVDEMFKLAIGTERLEVYKPIEFNGSYGVSMLHLQEGDYATGIKILETRIITSPAPFFLVIKDKPRSVRNLRPDLDVESVLIDSVSCSHTFLSNLTTASDPARIIVNEIIQEVAVRHPNMPLAKVRIYLRSKFNSYNSYNARGHSYFTYKLATSYMTDFERKLYLGMKLKPYNAKQVGAWSDLVRNGFSEQNLWNAPVATRLAYNYGFSLSTYKKAFRLLGGTKGGWKYMCGLRHADYLSCMQNKNKSNLHSFVSKMNIMSSCRAATAPKWAQHKVIELIDNQHINVNDPNAESYFENRFAIFKPLVQNIVKWSKRRSGLVTSCVFESVSATNEEGNPIILHKQKSKPVKLTTTEAKIEAIRVVWRWYIHNYRHFSRELLDADFRDWHKHATAYDNFVQISDQPSWTWDSLLKKQDIEINGLIYKVTPLNTSQLLFAEGKEQGNCVFDYVSLCIGHKEDFGDTPRPLSRIFKAEGAERLTIEICIGHDGECWVEEVLGRFNNEHTLSESEELTHRIANLYQEKLEACGGIHAEPREVEVVSSFTPYKGRGPLCNNDIHFRPHCLRSNDW